MFEIEVAKRHITSNRRSTIFTIITVSIAVGVIIMSLGLTMGNQIQIVQNTVEKNPHLRVLPKENEDYIYLYRNLAATVSRYPGVIAVSPAMVSQGAARYRDKVEGIEFVGADPEEEEKLRNIQEDTIIGKFSELKFKRDAAFLGAILAENLEVRPGNYIYISQKNRTDKVKVIGLIEKGTVKDSILVYLNLKTAQNLVGKGDVVSELGMKLSNYEDAPALAEELKLRIPYKVESWQDFNREIARLLGTQSKINVLFYGLIFVISGFVVANTTIMIVRRRTREIGMLMALGASRGSILKIFVIESLLLSIPAGILGIGFGFALGKAIESYPLNVSSGTTGVTRLMIDLRPEYAVYAIIFALLLNVGSSIYPAYVAARLDPVEAIGSE